MVDEKEKEEEHCVWDLHTPCEGKEEFKLMFDKQLKVPICEKHAEEHWEVMVLFSEGHPIEEIVDMTPEERKRLVYTMKLAGLSPGNVSI